MPKVVAIALLAASVASAEPAKPQPQLDPLEFFTGEVRGAGTIKVMMKAATTMRSESRGTPDGKGGLALEQKVHQAGKPVRISRWILRPTSKTTLTGTATDSAGPIAGHLSGNRLHLKYKTKDGLGFEQWMYLQPDRRTMLNRITVRKWGMVVARIEEKIQKLP